MNKDKKEVINTVKQDLELLVEMCKDLGKTARQALEVFDDFKSERTLWKLEMMMDDIRPLNNGILNLITVTKMACIAVKEEKEKAKEMN